jgi:hypothetical protein
VNILRRKFFQDLFGKQAVGLIKETLSMDPLKKALGEVDDQPGSVERAGLALSKRNLRHWLNGPSIFAQTERPAAPVAPAPQAPSPPGPGAPLWTPPAGGPPGR